MLERSGILQKKMAERSGFEPEDPVTQVNCLAGNCIQPLCHLSLPKPYYIKYTRRLKILRCAQDDKMYCKIES